MDIFVQSFLNSAAKLTISVSTTTTFTQLKTLVNAEEGTPASIMGFYVGTVEADSSSTMAVYNITTGSYVGSFNNIANSATREERQLAKLDLAQLRRQAAGNTTATFYRSRNVYDITELPTRYVGNTVVDNPNSGGLVEGRIWKE